MNERYIEFELQQVRAFDQSSADRALTQWYASEHCENCDKPVRIRIGDRLRNFFRKHGSAYANGRTSGYPQPGTAYRR